MAKIRETATTFFANDVTDCVVALPTHETDDLLLFVVSKDDATGGTLTTPSGWTKGGENAVGASGANTVRSAWYYKVATSGAETAPTVTSSDADTWTAVATSIRGVNTSSPIDTSNTNGVTDSAGAPYQAASVTTNYDNSLVFYTCGSDGGVSPAPLPGYIVVGVADSGADATGIAYKVQRTAGAAGTCDFICSGTADESVLFTIAVRDGSSGAIMPAYPNSDVATLVRPLKGANLVYSGDALDANSNNFTQLAGTWQNPTQVYQVDASPLTYTDITTAATNSTDADTVPFPATEATGDYLAIGYSATFRNIRFDRLGCTNGVAGVVVWEYLSSAGTWKALAQVYNGNTNFTATLADHEIVGFTVPTDWTSQSLNGNSRYWVRARITTVYTTNPTISQIFVSPDYALHHDTLTGLGDTGTIPLFDSTYVTPGFSGNAIAGGAYSMTSVQSLSTGIIMGTYIFATPRDFVDLGKRSDGGVVLGLLDSTNKVVAWSVGGSDQKDTIADKRNIFAIQLDQSTDTKLLTNTPTMTDIKRILLAANNRYGAVNVAFNQLVKVGTLKVSGGGSTAPVDYDELVRVANGYPVPMIDKITNTAYVPIQIGGADAVNCQMSGFTLSFPQQSTTANKTAGFHVDNNVAGVIIDARAGDTVKMTSGKFTSLSPYLFKFESTASSSATYDFAGLVVENATVTLRSVFTFDSMTFTDCPSFTLNGATMTNCSFNDTKVSAATPADADNISNSTFNSSGTGHAIEISGTAADMTLTNVDFTGYAGSNGSTGNEAIYVNIASGTVNINIAGGTTPSIRTAGATVNILNNQTYTLTGLEVGTEVVVFNSSNTELDREVIVGTAYTYTYNYTGDTTNNYILIWKDDKIPQKLTGITFGSSSVSVPITQTDDLVYNATYTDNVSFNFGTKRINMDAAATTYNVQHVYSNWKDTILTGTNAQYDFAFSIVGGNTTSGANSIPYYTFLVNSWRIKPDEANHTLEVTTGVLLVDGGGDPFVNTTGSYIVRINYQQPVQAIAVSGGGGGGGITAADVWSYTIASKTAANRLKDADENSELAGIT